MSSGLEVLLELSLGPIWGSSRLQWITGLEAAGPAASRWAHTWGLTPVGWTEQLILFFFLNAVSRPKSKLKDKNIILPLELLGATFDLIQSLCGRRRPSYIFFPKKHLWKTRAECWLNVSIFCHITRAWWLTQGPDGESHSQQKGKSTKCPPLQEHYNWELLNYTAVLSLWDQMLFL